MSWPICTLIKCWSGTQLILHQTRTLSFTHLNTTSQTPSLLYGMWLLMKQREMSICMQARMTTTTLPMQVAIMERLTSQQAMLNLFTIVKSM